MELLRRSKGDLQTVNTIVIVIIFIVDRKYIMKNSKSFMINK